VEVVETKGISGRNRDGLNKTGNKRDLVSGKKRDSSSDETGQDRNSALALLLKFLGLLCSTRYMISTSNKISGGAQFIILAIEGSKDTQPSSDLYCYSILLSKSKKKTVTLIFRILLYIPKVFFITPNPRRSYFLWSDGSLAGAIIVVRDLKLIERGKLVECKVYLAG
jgi:hypothetical protein